MIFSENAHQTSESGCRFAFASIRQWTRIALFVATVLFVVVFEKFGHGQQVTTGIGDDLWELSTRHLPCSACGQSTVPAFDVHRFTNCRWEKRTLDEAVNGAADSGPVPLTILYVHGNWMERDNALERVRIINGYISKQACEPYRMIMFSWPSQRDNRIIRDVRDNAKCADAEAYYFARLLQAVSASSARVSVLGFSFGSRTVSGGLHLDAGGTISGVPCLEVPGHSQYRVSLVAPAVDRDWLQANGRHHMAMNHVDSLVNLYNSRDPILRRFRFVDSIARPIAAGFAGFEAVANPRATTPLIGSDRIQQYDCGSQIGTTHSELDYYGKCQHFRKAIDNVLWKTP